MEVYPLRRLLSPFPERKRPKCAPASALLAYRVRACRL